MKLRKRFRLLIILCLSQSRYKMEEEKDNAEDLLYIGIVDAPQLRRDVLESQKSLIVALKKFEEAKMVRDNKAVAMQQFTKIVKEINLLNSKLRKALPKIGIKAPEEVLARKPRIESSQPTPFSERESRIKNLERDLNNIEGQLGELVKKRKIR